MIGTNDIIKSFPTDDIFADYSQIVEILESKGIEVVVQSTLECSIAICGKRLQAVRELNKKLLEYTESNGLAYVNVNSGMTSEDEGLLARYSADGVHLLGEGYSVWAKQYRNGLIRFRMTAARIQKQYA